MEIFAEIILQVFSVLLQFLGELLLQIIGEAIAELIGRSLKEPCRRPRPMNPILAGLGYLIFGAVAGGLSLWLIPSLFIRSQWLRIANLLLTPLLAGLLMARLGAWRREHEQETIRLDTFAYGFCFALSMAIVRFAWGQ